MFSRPKILFLVSLLFVALLNPKFNPYLLFKFLIFYHSSIIITCMNIIGYQIGWNLTDADLSVKWHYWPDSDNFTDHRCITAPEVLIRYLMQCV